MKPYVKRQKNDVADAEAICEALTRPSMRFVKMKTPEQQSALMLLRIYIGDCHRQTRTASASAIAGGRLTV